MEIELGPFPKYENERYSAFWARAGIDTTLNIKDYNIDDYYTHLLHCEKNPTVGLLVRKKYITGQPMYYPEYAYRNIRNLNKQPKIKILQQSIKNKIQKLYPKTKHIRQYIIDNERVTLDGIQKIKKYTIFNKLKIALKRFL